MGIEEKDVEMIEVQSPVYVRKDSIQDVLAVKELDNAIDAKSKEKEAKEVEVQSVKDDREKLSEDIGIINTGQHINEVALKIQKLRELDETTRIKESELEEIYSVLRKLQEDRDALDETARNMVDKMTEDYNSIVEKQVKLVENYRQTANFEVYNEVLKLTDEANEFAKYESYDAILEGKEAQSEEEKSQEETNEVEAPAPEKAQEEGAPELDNVKVDSLPEEENKEEKAVVTPIAETEVPVAEAPEVETPVAEVTPLPTDQPVISSGVEMKSFAQLVEETKDEEAKAPEVEALAVVTPIAETEAPVAEAPEVETPVAEVTPLASEPQVETPVEAKSNEPTAITALVDKTLSTLASSDVKGRNQTIGVFAKSNDLDKAKTLEKVA